MTQEIQKVKKNKGGRPSTIDATVIAKLEEAFIHTFTDAEACLYAGISVDALYRYEEKNPEFRERKQTLKLTPNLHAKKELVTGIKNNLGQARWWAEHKMPDFKPKVEVSGSMTGTGDISEAEEELRKKHDEDLRTILIGKPPTVKPKKHHD